jgi:signal transduction histidine kinase/FixJ family two-component response regulator
VGGDVDTFLAVLTDHARRITKAERACAVLVPMGGGERRIVALSPSPHPSDVPYRLSDTVIDRALGTRAPLLLHDVFGDSELIGKPSVLSMSLRSVLCVPVLRGNEIYGVIYADSSEGAGSFDSVDLDVLSLFADQAAAALDAARLFADLQRSYAELKATQDRLIRGERLRVMGEMTSGVAHEFNNLLTAILARVQLMDLGDLPKETHEHLRLIEKASLDAAAVVRRLQGFSRSQRQGSHKVIDLAEIGADVVELLRPLWTTRRRRGLAPIVVRYRAARGLLVSGDAIELREVFTNLIKNALDALDLRGGAIEVTVAERGGVIHTAISDDGEGIPPELLARLFTPFLTTKGDHGTGLGLCLCQQILERHGSKLGITSELARGTTASFEIPAAKTQLATASEAAPATAKGKLRVLVVDDDPNVLQPLCDYLTLSGLCVTAVDGGHRALDCVAGFHPDVVVSDIAMPDMDGIDLCAALRVGNPRLPVVLMSGQASEVDLARVRSSGASALLPKPFTMRQILELLQSIRTPGRESELAARETSAARPKDDLREVPKRL